MTPSEMRLELYEISGHARPSDSNSVERHVSVLTSDVVDADTWQVKKSQFGRVRTSSAEKEPFRVPSLHVK